MQTSRHLVLPVLLLALAGWNGVRAQISPAEQTFRRAMQNMDSGQYAAAEADFRQILKKDPANVSVLINLGVLQVKMHRITEAIESYKRASRIAPAQEAVQLNLGLAYLKQENYADAVPYFERLHQAHPDDAQIATLLATALAYSGKPLEGVQLLGPFTGPDSQNRGALYVLGLALTRADRSTEAREVLGRVFAGAPPAQEAFLLGEAYLEATDYSGAAQSFQSALSAQANFPGAHRELGRAYLGLHQNEQAEQQLRVATQADSGDTEALYLLGALLVQLSRWSDGRAVLQKAQAVAPDSWATAFYLGKAEFELHNSAAAEKQLRRAAELNPDEPGAPYLLARIVRGEGHTEEAARLMERVAALHATALDAEKKAVERANHEKSHVADAN